ncbi:MAG: hypothetical protein K6B65_00420 [Bacilli bacterium]|nr:hypothetical protein [Bacilli bacterium]
MKSLVKALKKRTTAVFFDLEGTGTSHEIVEIGAIKATLKPDGTIKKVFKPFHYYVMPKAKMGSYVSSLTGLTDRFLEENGIPFRVMQKSLTKYVGKDYKNAVYFCYGDQDPHMFIYSAENNMDASMEEAKFVAHHCFNFLSFFSRYVTGDDGNPINLTKACDLFGVKPTGKAHTALADAYGLMNLYSAFLEKTDLVASEYRKTLFRGRGLPEPFRIVLARLQKGESIDLATFDNILKESLE